MNVSLDANFSVMQIMSKEFEYWSWLLSFHILLLCSDDNNNKIQNYNIFAADNILSGILKETVLKNCQTFFFLIRCWNPNFNDPHKARTLFSQHTHTHTHSSIDCHLVHGFAPTGPVKVMVHGALTIFTSVPSSSFIVREEISVGRTTAEHLQSMCSKICTDWIGSACSSRIYFSLRLLCLVHRSLAFKSLRLLWFHTRYGIHDSCSVMCCRRCCWISQNSIYPVRSRTRTLDPFARCH